MRVSEATLGLSLEDRDGYIRKGLTYGHMDKNFVDRIFRNAQRITAEMVRHYTGRDRKIDDSLFSMPEPPNVAEVQQLIKMLVGNLPVANTFAPIADLLVYEKFLKQRNGIEWLQKIFPYSNLRDRVGLVQDYLRTLRAIDAVPDLPFFAGPAQKSSPAATPASTSSMASKLPTGSDLVGNGTPATSINAATENGQPGGTTEAAGPLIRDGSSEQNSS